MERPNEEPQFNLSHDLICIHAVISRGLEISTQNAANFLEQGGYPDEDIRKGYHRYVHALLELLDAHHAGEDAIAWPFLRERIPNAPYDRLTAQHEQMNDLLEEAREAFESEDLAALREKLASLFAAWRAHIELEEATFSESIANQRINLDEQMNLSRRLARYSYNHAEPNYLVVPFMLYNLPPRDRETMARRLPVDVTQDLVPGPWKEKWAPMQPFFYPA